MRKCNLLGALFIMTAVCAADRFVAPNGPSLAPYDTWAKAASNIQDAVAAATSNETIWVTNGVYRTGGRSWVDSTYSSRVVTILPVTIRSVNGADVTVIEGQPAPGGSCGTGAVRCAYLQNGTQLIGFTLSNGYTMVGGFTAGAWGGGAIVRSGARISQCRITHCTASGYGGGLALWGGTADACLVEHTTALDYGDDGIQADYAVVSNCTVRQVNGAGIGLYGASYGIGCVIEDNNGLGVGLLSGSTLVASRIAGNHGRGVLMMDNARLSACTVYGHYMMGNGGGVWARASLIDNCVISGNVATNDGGGVYLEDFGNLMVNCTVVGNSASNRGGGVLCYHGATNVNNIVLNNTARVAASSNFFTVYSDYVFRNCCIAPLPTGGALCADNFAGDPRFADAAGQDYHLTFGSDCYNAGANAFVNNAEDREGVQRIITGYVDVGAHEYVPEYVFGPGLRHVALDGGNLWPYTNAVTAARTLQAALDSAGLGDRILVAPGTYTRNYASFRGLKNRMATVVPVTIEALSSNAPGATLVLGESDINGGLGTNGFAMRAAYLTNGCTITGMTLANGYTRNAGTPVTYLRAGGGALCDRDVSLSQCIIADNHADEYGGGVLCNNGGVLYNCTMQDNTAGQGGAVYFNSAGLALNCLLVRNTAETTGGAVYFNAGGECQSCTIAGNSAGTAGGGIYLFAAASSNLNNIIYGNTAASAANCSLLAGRLGYSCTEPLPAALYSSGGNISNMPQFASATDFHVLAGSPCIDTGTNLPWMAGATDLDGNPRVVDGLVDMGCYEFVPEPGSALLLALCAIYNLRLTIERRKKMNGQHASCAKRFAPHRVSHCAANHPSNEMKHPFTMP